MKGSVTAISGIGTGVGKTVVTGLLAQGLQKCDRKVVTQKIVQTGCTGISSDILEHRRLMGSSLIDVDYEGVTCPYSFGYPASPHLAARLEGAAVEVMTLRRATFTLQKQFDHVLLEGVGGLLVPLAPDLLFADYIRDAGYPLILVTATGLGSINHTLLSLEACIARRITLKAVICNRFGEIDTLIGDDTVEMTRHYLKKYGLRAPLFTLVGDTLDCGCIESLFL
ncbi:dethiobiotin synthase [Chlorobium phaeobacteroides]|uniref:ATP-dependent dethiobiotin synthetase BioD n=1 Tax=Chlorobium phaeobacteroides (strain DSM 266 / SMG 266 / 2430) TaxID=290317 RepID=A1BCQ9_CHLPD|nr:dethiobiotin synthase [Chlorobium phaeobacteroides]ABL64186.1 dethiobiotin synthase [Chlorobium phaeobacteroides DSM 266]